MKTNKLMLTLALTAVLAACSTAETRPAMTSGSMLTGSNGMTLYVFDKDEAGSGQSWCTGACATNWPPLFAPYEAMASGDYSVIKRGDGNKQWAYKGKPLYFWSKDQKVGDTTGDGFNNLWHVAKP